MSHAAQNSESQIRVKIEISALPHKSDSLSWHFNIEYHRTHWAVETVRLNLGRISLMWVCTWACRTATLICLYDSDNKMLMRDDKSGEIRLEEHNRKDEKKQSWGKRLLFFSFASCCCNYVGSCCVMVIVTLSLYKWEIWFLQSFWARESGKR